MRNDDGPGRSWDEVYTWSKTEPVVSKQLFSHACQIAHSEFSLFSTGASLRDDLYKYFFFHHSHGDTMTVMDPKQMNVAAAVWAVVAYVVADMDEMLPRS